jgi:hypothetical protein
MHQSSFVAVGDFEFFAIATYEILPLGAFHEDKDPRHSKKIYSMILYYLKTYSDLVDYLWMLRTKGGNFG